MIKFKKEIKKSSGIVYNFVYLWFCISILLKLINYFKDKFRIKNSVKLLQVWFILIHSLGTPYILRASLILRLQLIENLNIYKNGDSCEQVIICFIVFECFFINI